MFKPGDYVLNEDKTICIIIKQEDSAYYAYDMYKNYVLKPCFNSMGERYTGAKEYTTYKVYEPNLTWIENTIAQIEKQAGEQIDSLTLMRETIRGQQNDIV